MALPSWSQLSSIASDTIMTTLASMTHSLCPALLRDHAGPRMSLIAESYARLLGRPLLGDGADPVQGLWSLPRVVLAHGTETDPLFFYGNCLALELFELTPEQLITMPSRLSAEPLRREERAQLLARVAENGFIDDYSGIRVSSGGRRFRIYDAVVWNLIDTSGKLHGQAATFALPLTTLPLTSLPPT
ncbi:MAG: MEKHLA domain-containing protein [Pseudomonadota bacterium]